MNNQELNQRIIASGETFLDGIPGEAPAIFNRKEWIGQVMDWCMRHEDFKIRLFRFVDAFPSMTTPELFTQHIREYFGGDDAEMPAILKWGAKAAGWSHGFGANLMAKTFRTHIEEMARLFIVGETIPEAIQRITRLRQEGFAAVVDCLGEATLSDAEAEEYVTGYLALLDALQSASVSWDPLGAEKTGPDWHGEPPVNVAVKPTALCCRVNPMDFDGSVHAMLAPLRRVFDSVRACGGFLSIDMESYRYKDLTIELYRRLKLEHPAYPHLGIALQAYLKDTDQDVDRLLAWAGRHQTEICIRLVKGAYWDFETIRAAQNGWEAPVYSDKAESDAAFERLAGKILRQHERCRFACASHNVRSITAVLETARALKVPESRYEFQALYGMAEPVRKALLKNAGRVRLYAPFGRLVPGMGYLVRRLLENTANESFLRRSFAEKREWKSLLEDPVETLQRRASSIPAAMPVSGNELPAFHNEPPADFSREEQRREFAQALTAVRRKPERLHPLYINGHEVVTGDVARSFNPAAPSEAVGAVCLAGEGEIRAAVLAADAAFPSWRDTPPRVRAAFLVRAAAIVRRRRYELAATQVLEIGKQWDQAYADVAEAVDFLEYYAREMIRLAEPKKAGNAPGEDNRCFYEPRGVTAVIAPWNFPLAISCGMASAAIVAGNCVVYKPSMLTPIAGVQLMEIFREAQLPAGVFNFVPGRSAVVGDLLSDHPGIHTIAFTGSVEVGTRIFERAARLQPGQRHLKKVVCEMGGKNAVIVDDDADLDEAIPNILQSAFGFQGQKCSACSRVIVPGGIYEAFVRRFIPAVRSLRIGPAEDPGYDMGPVADADQQQKILAYAALAGKEGVILYQSAVPEGGYYVPLTVVGGIKPDSRIAQEEIFGPVLAIQRARDFDEALAWANGTRFALTGAVFSRSPRHLEQARREFRVGNLYLNRGCTGALVERQPFGGGRLSGTGTKAGGPDYLLHFMEPRVVSENTMRRGFAPRERSLEEMKAP